MESKKCLKCCGLFFIIFMGLFVSLLLGFNMENALDDVAADDNALVIFNHPRRYNVDDDFYIDFLEKHPDMILGLEVINKGSTSLEDRDLWDRLNARLSPDSLIWGFSNDDSHRPSQLFKAYQHMLMPELTEEALRGSMISGAFYFSVEPNGDDKTCDFYGVAMTPNITDVSINNQVISVTGEGYDTIEWYNNGTEIIHNETSIDVSVIDSNFVRVILTNEYGITYSQPFGLAGDVIYNPYDAVNWDLWDHYKANFHTHTTESDGEESPAKVIDRYHEAGYKILAITDHNMNTWPWSHWIDHEPETPSRSAEYYPGLDMLAVSGNEPSLSHHFNTFFTPYAGFALDLQFQIENLLAG